MRLWNVSACMLALFVVACGGGSVTTVDPQTAGTVQLPLVTQSSDGKTYRLTGATFNIVGAQTISITDTSDDTVQTTLEAGSYTVELAGTWTLERQDGPGVSTPVTASLLSPNPLPFFVTKGEVTQVRFQFKLPGDGTADVGIKVDSGGWLAGTIQFTELDNPNGPSSWSELVGKSVPFLVSYDAASINKNGAGSLNVMSTGPVTVQFGGAPSALLQRAAAVLSKSPIFYDLYARQGATIDFMGLYFPGSTDDFRLDLLPTYFQGEVDSQGYPAQRPFQFNTTAVLRDSMGGVRGQVTVNGQP